MTTTSSIPVFVTGSSLTTITLLSLVVFILLSTLFNVLFQLCSRKEVNKPPLVFHYFPIIGSTITYGKDPLAFFQDCKAKYGNVFTFVLLGRPVTVYLGANGNNFILNGKQSELSAEEVYSPLTTPVFGTDVIFDCDNAKFMQQKKFVKFGLSQAALESYVQLITRETTAFFTSYTPLQSQGKGGDVKARIVDVPSAMAELTIYTASSSLQGAEVRRQFSSSGSRIADLYHDLDMGFSPINFFLPSWFPLPRNRKRDAAQREMTKIYTDIISERRRLTNNTCDSDDGKEETEKQDMIWNLMSNCTYKNGNVLPDKEIAHMMIALLLGGHHSSSAVIAFAILSLANRPDIQEKLYEEQVRELGDAGLTYEGLQRLKLHTNVIKETLRLYNPIHSIMRLAKTPLIVKDESGMVVPSGHTLLASPAFSARDETYFADPLTWDPHRWEKKASVHETSDDDELSAKGANSPYLPFGGGRHRCIGEKFAYVQLGVILAIFTRFFQVRGMHGNTDALLATDYSSLFSRPLAPPKFSGNLEMDFRVRVELITFECNWSPIRE
ncbi:cytochrome P450 [Talaromyces proteolyticus]|uniref:Cytochrome P450 n=1 Tax=Talaromyces proteolyticus TaxID=1131652 RepID=A0AAD4KEU3_9EURO|nr:cytochrome P450 [Talaromyces proteolyticus]KAH8690273.1 cytochrome P450 [Talaromyces proteolyticus]